MGRGTIIIVAVIIAWQIVTAIAQSAAKRKERERMAAVAQQRRPGTKPTATAPGPARTAQAPTRVGGSTRTVDLAARRAQLEELRKRRASGAGRGTGTTVRTGPGTAPAPGPAARATRGQPTMPTAATARPVRRQAGAARASSAAAADRGLAADRGAIRAAEEERRLRQRAAEEQSERGAAEAWRRRDAERDRDRQARRERQRREALAELREQQDEDAYAIRMRRGGTRARYRQMLSQAGRLRELIVLKEILEPPVALRPVRA